jgi:hypothetical protein
MVNKGDKIAIYQSHSDDALFSASKFLFNKEEYEDVVLITVENNPDYKQGRVGNEIEATLWAVKPIHGETRYVLNPEHRNNEFTAMLYKDINMTAVNIMVGLLDNFNDNVKRDLRGIYKVTVEKIED